MRFIKIIQSVLSAFIGIQKTQNLNEDDSYIEKNGFMPYLITGLIMAIIFILLIISVVTIILE